MKLRLFVQCKLSVNLNKYLVNALRYTHKKIYEIQI